VLAQKFNIMDDTLRLELFEFLRESLTVEISMDTEYEGCNEYATCSASIRLRHPITGEYEEIGSGYDSVCIKSD
jgi:hypothetical protein